VDSPNESICCCGYSKQWHVKRNIDVDYGNGRRDISRGKAAMMIVSNPRSGEDFAVAERAWDENLHIGNFSSWCYGVIQFLGFPEDGSRYPVPVGAVFNKQLVTLVSINRPYVMPQKDCGCFLRLLIRKI